MEMPHINSCRMARPDRPDGDSRRDCCGSSSAKRQDHRTSAFQPSNGNPLEQPHSLIPACRPYLSGSLSPSYTTATPRQSSIAIPRYGVQRLRKKINKKATTRPPRTSPPGRPVIFSTKSKVPRHIISVHPSSTHPRTHSINQINPAHHQASDRPDPPTRREPPTLRKATNTKQ